MCGVSRHHRLSRQSMGFAAKPILPRQPASAMNTILGPESGACRQNQGREPLGPGPTVRHRWNLRWADRPRFALDLADSKPVTLGIGEQVPTSPTRHPCDDARGGSPVHRPVSTMRPCDQRLTRPSYARPNAGRITGAAYPLSVPAVREQRLCTAPIATAPRLSAPAASLPTPNEPFSTFYADQSSEPPITSFDCAKNRPNHPKSSSSRTGHATPHLRRTYTRRTPGSSSTAGGSRSPVERHTFRLLPAPRLLLPIPRLRTDTSWLTPRTSRANQPTPLSQWRPRGRFATRIANTATMLLENRPLNLCVPFSALAPYAPYRGMRDDITNVPLQPRNPLTVRYFEHGWPQR